MKMHPIVSVALVLALTGPAAGQSQPAPAAGTPAPDVGPPPVTRPGAVHQAVVPEESRMEADPFMDFNDPRVRAEMAECTRLPREARSECVRGLRSPDRGDPVPGGPAGDVRERSPSAPRDPGVPLRDRDPGLSMPR